MKYRLIFLLILCYLFQNVAFSQVADDFSDGDFTQNPSWTGDTGHFVVNASSSLQLQAPAVAGKSYLALESGIVANAEWSFYIQLAFNPSSANYADIFLVSDQENLKGALNGYFVRIGNTQDEVSLYRQSGTSMAKIIDGLDGRTNLSTVSLKVKVTKDHENRWELLVDPSLDGSFISEGNVIDSIHKYSHYFGVSFTYTSTRSDKFFFDDLRITGDVFSDSKPPQVDSLSVLDDSSIAVYFNEDINASSVTDPAHYSIDRDIGIPAAASMMNSKTVRLTLQKKLSDGGTYTLTIDGVEDKFRNVMARSTYAFSYTPPFDPTFGDLIITEIMAVPSPEVGLPLWEYLEVFNPHDVPLFLNGLKLIVGSDTAHIPSIMMDAREYLILCQSTAATDMGRYGKSVIVPGWPTLNNDGESIQLLNAKDQLIFSVSYDVSWYKSIDKDDGGWSLEMIDTHFPCKGKENWTASIDPSGGTPGRQNASAESLTDFTSPSIVQAIVVDRESVIVYFSEKLLPLNLEIDQFNINPPVAIQSVHLHMPEHSKITIHTAEEMKQRTVYQLSVKQVRDCPGNISNELSTSFVLPEEADSLDIIINEVLFNPPTGGVDFVELYNRSDKTIDLKNWKIENESVGIISIDHLVLAPKHFLAITSHGNILKSMYPAMDNGTWWEATSFPSLNDDEGQIALKNASGQTIDLFEYRDDMHSRFLKDTEGVSLERINYEGPSNESSNWQSAAESAGFATPGSVNSQYYSGQLSADEVIVAPEVFDPGSGGSDSFTLIKCRFPAVGNIVNISIVDAAGRVVRTIATHQSIGTEEDFKWEGDSDQGGEVRMGPYIVYVEVYDVSGSRKIYRKKVVAGGRF